MVIGVLTVEIAIDSARSLKDKRAVLNRLKAVVQRKFNVSIAEIDAQDVWNLACLGVAVVTNEQRYANRVLCKVVELVDSARDCVLEEYSTDFIRSD